MASAVTENAPLLPGTAEKNQDSTVSKEEIGPNTDLIESSEALVTSIKSLIGSGLLAMPYAFRISGLIGGTLIVISSAWVCYFGGVLLIESKATMKRRHMFGSTEPTFGDVASGCFGRSGRIFSDFLITVLQLGTVTAYEIFVIQNLLQVLSPEWSTNAVAVLCMTPVLALFLVRKVHYLAQMAFIADIFILIGIIICSILIFANGSFQMPHLMGGGSSVLAFGIAIFSIEGICLILPIETSMKSPELYTKRVWAPSMALAGSLYVVFGSLGFSAFSDRTEDIAMLNLSSSPLKTTLQIVYCTALLLSAPLQALPVFQLLEREYLPKNTNDDAFRLFIAMFTTAIASLVPHFALVLGVLGSICGSMLGFGLPALVYLQLHQDTISWSKRSCLYGMVCISIALSIVGCIAAITFEH